MSRKFDALLCDPKNAYWFQLKPGKMLSKSPNTFSSTQYLTNAFSLR